MRCIENTITAYPATTPEEHAEGKAASRAHTFGYAYDAEAVREENRLKAAARIKELEEAARIKAAGRPDALAADVLHCLAPEEFAAPSALDRVQALSEDLGHLIRQSKDGALKPAANRSFHEGHAGGLADAKALLDDLASKL